MTRIRSVVRWAIPIVWAAAMLAARRFDPSTAIAIGAILMTGAVLASDGALIARLLRPSSRAAAVSAIAAAVMIAATYLLFPLLVRAVPAIAEMSADIYSRFLSGRTPMAIATFVVPVIVAEEILWRGAFQEAMGMKSPSATVLLSAAIYAAAHAPLGSALLVAVAFVCGIYWAALRAFSGSLLPSLAAHLVWDVAIILVPLVL